MGDDGEDVVAGDPGEIWVRGPNVFVGYWDDPDATSRVLVDGWLRTGDVAVADDDGFLSLVDRKKDLIIVSGFNVFPAEVEDVLLDHPDIADAAVIGVPSPRTGEAVAACVVADARRDADGRGRARARGASAGALQGSRRRSRSWPRSAQRSRQAARAASYDTWARTRWR